MMSTQGPLATRAAVAARVEKLHGRLLETSLWFSSVATPLAVEVAPAVRRRILEASRLLHMATEAVETAARLSNATPEDIRKMLDIEDGAWGGDDERSV